MTEPRVIQNVIHVEEALRLNDYHLIAGYDHEVNKKLGTTEHEDAIDKIDLADEDEDSEEAEYAPKKKNPYFGTNSVQNIKQAVRELNDQEAGLIVAKDLGFTIEDLLPYSDWTPIRMFLHDVTEDKYFNGLILTCILLNTLTIMISTTAYIKLEISWQLEAADWITMGIYLTELSAKLFVWRSLFWKSGWNIFDFIIILIAMLEVSFVSFMGSIFSSGQNFDPKIFRLLRIFRSLRAVRALRVLRTITFFSSLQIIVGTLLRSIPAWGAISALLFLVLYAFAITGTSLYGEYNQVAFGNIQTSFFTLFGMITLDDWFTLVNSMPEEKSGSMFIFLVAFILAETFIFINLLVAVVVNNLQMAKDKQTKKAQLLEASRKRQAEASKVSDKVTGIAKEVREKPKKHKNWIFRDSLPNVPKENLTHVAKILGQLHIMEENIFHFQTGSQQLLDLMVDAAFNDEAKKAL